MSKQVNTPKHFFYHPNLQKGSNQLSTDESRHCLKVLRLKKSDDITILDGKGHQYQAQIIGDRASICSFEITATTRVAEPRPFHVHIVVAPTKNLDRMEWFVEKSVELGIDKISFILCHRSERKKLKTDRLHKRAISALKQSGNLLLPEITEMGKFNDFIARADRNQERFIAHAASGARHLKQLASPQQRYLVLIGPEGGFSQSELEFAYESGFKNVSLGDGILRTETAGLVACHTLVLANTI